MNFKKLFHLDEPKMKATDSGLKHDKWRLFWLSVVVLLGFISGWMIQKHYVLPTPWGDLPLEFVMAGFIVICIWSLLWREYLSHAHIGEHMELLNMEMAEREKAQQQLQSAYDEIEEKIRLRTHDLVNAQEELRSSNALLNAVFQNMQTGLLVMPQGSRKVIVNKAFSMIWQLDTKEDYWECRKIFPRLYERVREVDDLVSQLEEIGIQRKEGDPHLLHLTDNRLVETYFLHFYVGKEVKGRIHLFRDVTEQEANRIRLQTTVSELETFKRGLDFHAQVSICDQDGKITYVNEQMCETTGYSREELLGKTYKLVNSGHHSFEFFEEMWRMLKRGNIWRGEICNKKKSDEFYWVYSTIVPYFNKDGEPTQYLAISADITERKRSEEQLQQAKETAESATRAKSEFLANISHEIRTPMNAILGFTELLMGEVQEPRQREYLRLVNASGNTLLELINDLLDLSKIEAGKFTIQLSPFDLRDLIQEIQNIFLLRVREKKLQLLVEINESLPRYILGDEIRIRQILFNLVGNAVKFTETGYVKMTLSAVFAVSNAPRFSLKMEVSDTGIGISSQNIKRIFEAFQQADGQSVKKYGGTGLGLTITRRLIEMMSGKLQVESEEGKGSTFSVILDNIEIPSSESITASLIQQMSLVETPMFEPATVLIADDAVWNRKVFASFFEESGVTVIEAEDGNSALKKVHDLKPDLVLVDMIMPEMSGIDVAKHIKADPTIRHIPIILVTAMNIEKIGNNYDIKDVDAYLFKPVDRTQIFSTVRRFLKIKPPLSSTLNPFPEKATIADEESLLELGAPLVQKTVKNLDEMLNTLEGVLMEEWGLINKRMKSQSLLQFAETMHDIGSANDYEPLVKFGNLLKKRVEIFDIGSIRQILQLYPNIITALGKHRKK